MGIRQSKIDGNNLFKVEWHSYKVGKEEAATQMTQNENSLSPKKDNDEIQPSYSYLPSTYIKANYIEKLVEYYETLAGIERYKQVQPDLDTYDVRK